MILIVLGSFDTSGRVFRALGTFSEEACTGVLVSCNNVEDGVGASARVKLGVSLAVTATGVVDEVVGVVDVCMGGDFKVFFLLVERAIL